jgi:hypothetical protein
MARVTMAELLETKARTELLLRRAGELAPDERLDLRRTGDFWSIGIRKVGHSEYEGGHPALSWFGFGGTLERTKSLARWDLQRTNAALLTYMRRVGKPTE